ncbi:MAG: hypothetical protein JWR80_8557 [Bradyrhizobium sp.]|nr:hypothetical protein [Bradyrhizobium sp.]
MGKLLAFPGNYSRNGGTVHVLPREHGGYEIAHESASGNSWGHFENFEDPQEAVAAGYRLNRDVLESSCEVFISPAVLADMPDAPDRGAF